MKKRGQATFEYAIILGIVVLALGMMQVYLRRGIQAGIKIAADELGRQQDSVELDPTKGTTQKSQVRSVSSATHQIQHVAGGGRSVTISEKSEIIYVDEETPSHSEYWNNWEEK